VPDVPVMTQLKLRAYLSKSFSATQPQQAARPPKAKGAGAQRRRRPPAVTTPSPNLQHGRAPHASPKVAGGSAAAAKSTPVAVPSMYANDATRALGHRVLHGMASAAATVLSEFEASACSSAACATAGAKVETLSSASTAPSGVGVHAIGGHVASHGPENTHAGGKPGRRRKGKRKNGDG
jgi:hypothetical protein